MNTEKIEYKGYKIEVAQDESPENPFEAWACEPPLVTYYGGRHGYAKSYQGAPETMREVLHMLPAETWNRGKRMEFFKRFMSDKFGIKEVAGEIRRYGNTFDAISDLLSAEYGEKPSGWRSAVEWFEMAESLLQWAGIECVNTQSNGYSQGDSTLVLAIASPDWLKTTGIKQEHVTSSLQASVDLYGAWAWGDVYGVSSIHKIETDEDGDEAEGEEIEDASCYGFYGRDFEKSGLMEHARSEIDYAIKQEQEAALNEPACLI